MRQFIFILFALSFFLSCSPKEEKVQPESNLGKYVYQDDEMVIHSSESCIKLRYGNDDKGHSIYAKHLIDTTEFVIRDKDNFRVCSRCVNDELYEQLVNVSKRNTNNCDNTNDFIFADSVAVDTVVAGYNPDKSCLYE